MGSPSRDSLTVARTCREHQTSSPRSDSLQGTSASRVSRGHHTPPSPTACVELHASLLPHACNGVATRLKALVCARLVLFRPLHPDLKIWGHGTAAALSAHGSDRSAVRDGSPSLLEERIVTLFGHLQAFCIFAPASIPPAPCIGRGWPRTNGISCTALLMHLARLVRLAGLPHLTIFDTHTLDTQHLIDFFDLKSIPPLGDLPCGVDADLS